MIQSSSQTALLDFCFTYSFALSSNFVFNDTATTEIYTLSLHDALPISKLVTIDKDNTTIVDGAGKKADITSRDRKSTRLNSSHRCISYAVFCLKKKKKKKRKVRKKCETTIKQAM